MKNIIFAILICIMPSIIQASHVLPYKVEWKTNKIINADITLRSTILLKDWKIKRIEQIYHNSEDLFFNDFEDIICDRDSLGHLEIRVVSADMLRDRRYFRLATPRNFGRYFTILNTIYIIYDVFNHPEYLSHELAHYFYDECGVGFGSDNAEHIKVYRFQDLYKERYK